MPFPTSPVYENLFHRRAAVTLDVVIVGGSIAGLSAAYNLKQAGHNVRVLEKSNGKLTTCTAMRIPPNMAKLLLHWGVGEQLKARGITQCPKINFVDGMTGELQSTLIYHKELMKELQADMYNMRYGDLYELIRDIALRSGVKIDYNTTVIDVDKDCTFVLLEDGSRINADLIVGADGTYSLLREKIVGKKEVHPLGPFKMYNYLVPVDTLQKDPLLQPLTEDGSWTLWMGDLQCTLGYLAAPDHYLVQHIDTKNTGTHGWKQTVPLSELDFSAFEERVQRLLSLSTHAAENQHIVQTPIESWYSNNGRLVLVGNSVHLSSAGSMNEVALSVEDGAVLGSLFSRLQSRDQEEILRLLAAYQKIRQDRCNAILQTDNELLTFSTLPPGSARDERNAGFARASEQNMLDWENVDEDVLRSAWEEFRNSFGYEAYDAADDWWVDWGIVVHRLSAAQNASTIDDDGDASNGECSSPLQAGLRTSILDGLHKQTVITTVEN
ncbi:FAD/NAD-binding domain-containing protein [Fomitiporia mediterranea MF3/22]|uniref:FAD/NAD-binding domain-containing protein n=1 Tax=Fomitiporia mediterranea (strain MF3/22) TaxID=694068 RepID=UPI0004409572|nr:FAD/NAD-binding domain-containing protein [Fomitiporia mediterranea MF3/22]EJD05385.1 FAD/NAD-binding domain-containing protein [Fomitiporia mediterranea MF3/22]